MNNEKKLFFYWPFILFFWLTSADANAYSTQEPTTQKIEVKVGLGARPPFYLEDNPIYKGAGPEILDVMNQIQDLYHFSAYEIPPKRKIAAIKNDQMDIMMWDNLNWGWSGHDALSSVPLIKSKDLYIALKTKGRGQKFFEQFATKKTALVIGYHYKIVDNITDINRLTQLLDVTMVRSEEASLRMLVAERVDITVVSETALNWFLIRFPEYRPKILISKQHDSQYQRSFIVEQSRFIKVDEINKILQKADNQGLLAPIYHRYGLIKPESFSQ